MIPEKNGVVVELLEYNCWIRADAYLLEGALILRTSAERDYVGMLVGKVKADVEVSRIDHWFDENRNYGTMIVLPGFWEGDLS